MQIPDKVQASRAFIKKARQFIKYYPLRRKDPLQMLLETITRLEREVESAKDISELDPVSKEAMRNTNYKNFDDLYQFAVIDESKRFIIYYPSKFIGLKSVEDETIYLYDLIIID